MLLITKRIIFLAKTISNITSMNNIRDMGYCQNKHHETNEQEYKWQELKNTCRSISLQKRDYLALTYTRATS